MIVFPFLRTPPIFLGSICCAGFCLSGSHALASCTFTDVIGGTFGTPSQNQGWLEAASTISGAGTSATATVNCTTDSQISAATIAHGSTPPGFDSGAAQERAIVRYLSGGKFLNSGDTGFNPSGAWTQTNSADFNLPTNTNAVLDISLVVGFADNRVLPAGNYQYSVTITASPQ